MRLTASIVLFALAPLVLVAGAAQNGKDKKDSKETPQQIIFRLTNEFRKAEGKAVLKHNEKLARAAQKHAENLARQDKVGDDGNPHILDGKNPRDRAEAEGYKGGVGENIAFNAGAGVQAVKAFDGLTKSPGHRANMLKDDIREMGVGVAASKDGKWWYCQVFGDPD